MSTRAALALTQASWRTAKSYRFSFVLSFVSLAVAIIPVYFVANALQEFMAPVISSEGRDYFGFVLIGTAILTLVSAALSSFGSAVSGGLSSGFFEALLVTPTPLGLLLAGQTGYSFAWAAARGILLVAAGLLLGSRSPVGYDGPDQQFGCDGPSRPRLSDGGQRRSQPGRHRVVVECGCLITTGLMPPGSCVLDGRRTAAALRVRCRRRPRTRLGSCSSDPRRAD